MRTFIELEKKINDEETVPFCINIDHISSFHGTDEEKETIIYMTNGKSDIVNIAYSDFLMKINSKKHSIPN
jgi:uncharacterized protein YlzI (FlbEa/FlbD family)